LSISKPTVRWAWQHIAFGSAKADAGELADAATELRTGTGIDRIRHQAR